MEIRCDANGTDGKRCDVPATHFWGPAHFCCEHFSRLIEGIFDMQNAVREGLALRTHQDLVRFYEEKTNRFSRFANVPCIDSDKPKDK